MHGSSRTKSNAVSEQRRRNAETNARKSLARSKSVDPAGIRQRPKNDLPKVHIEKRSLEDYGYYFNNDSLVSTENDKPFEFDVYPHDEDNQKRYHSIGRLVDDYVYNLLVSYCHLQRITIPIDAKNNEPTGFFFASDDFLTAKYLVIIIHGTGVVRAGQWSRKLIINEDLQVGSQLEYIQQARSDGYAVIVTNTNLNTDESSQSIHNKSRYIRGSESPEEHACYIWENFIRQSRARHICIIAHSYGGAVMLELACRYTTDFDKHVFAVALTDSPMKAYTKHCSAKILKMLQQRTVNWIGSREQVNTDLGVRDYGRLRSAGHTLHEWTSYVAFRAVVLFLREERQKLERYKP